MISSRRTGAGNYAGILNQKLRTACKDAEEGRATIFEKLAKNAAHYVKNLYGERLMAVLEGKVVL